MNLRRLLFVVTFLSGLVSISEAQEYKTALVSLTDRVYGPIEVNAVTAEHHHPTKEWFKKLDKRNGEVADDLALQPLAELEVTRGRSKEKVSSFEPYMAKAKSIAARMGGNFLYLERPVLESGETVGLFFKVYRVEYQNTLVQPGYLASFSPQTIKTVSTVE